MERYVRQELGTNLEARLRKLEETGYDVDLLRLMEQIVRTAGTSKDAIDAPQLEDDLARLKNWGVDEISKEMRTQG